MVTVFELIPNFDDKCTRLINCTNYGFTRREAEILVLSCHDIEVETIASIIHRTRCTVLKHRENAIKKTPFNTLMHIATVIWPYINK